MVLWDIVDGLTQLTAYAQTSAKHDNKSSSYQRSENQGICNSDLQVKELSAINVALCAISKADLQVQS